VQVVFSLTPQNNQGKQTPQPPVNQQSKNNDSCIDNSLKRTNGTVIKVCSENDILKHN